MSMNGNHDYDYATSAVGAANANAAQEFNDAVRADALIHASLAIAHELRTANLLALWSNPQSKQKDMNGNTTYSIDSDTPGKIIEQVIERLGLA